MKLLKTCFSKKDICVIFNIPLHILESYIKKNKIMNDSENKNQTHYGVTYTYDILKLTKREDFKEIIDINIINNLDNILNEYVYYFDIEDKEVSERKRLRSELSNKNSFLKNEYIRIEPELNKLKSLDKLKRKEIEKEKKNVILNNIEQNYLKILNDELYNEDRKNTNYILHVGETNSGKTYKAIEHLKTTGGIYLAPLRLLAWEIFEKLNSNNIICSLITGEEQIKKNNSIIDSCTIEMLNYDKYYNTVIIDECFMLNDKDRGKSWLKSITHSNANTVHLITNKETKDLIVKILKTLDRNNITINEYDKLVPLEINENININKPPKKSLLVCFSRISVLRYKAQYELLGYNVSVLYGNLPPEIKKKEIERFNNGQTDICITTDVVGMGLNLPCDNVIFLENTKFDGVTNRILTNTEIKQISGRAGRFGLSEKGFVSGVGIQNIKKALNTFNNVNHTYLGFDYKTVCNIPNKTMKERINLWLETNIIPDKLKNNIFKEDTSKYTNLITQTIISIENKNKELGWNLLYAPVKENNKSYFHNICDIINKGGKIPKPKITNSRINDTNSLKNAEDSISKLDIYMYFKNNKLYKDYFDEDDNNLKDLRYKIIDSITEFLLNKKLSSKKHCQTCGKNVGINWLHKDCEECHQDKYDYYW